MQTTCGDRVWKCRCFEQIHSDCCKDCHISIVVAENTPGLDSRRLGENK
jgi:hypothetical protein